MPKYDVIHKETGETKIVEMSVHDISQWYEENPEWKPAAPNEQEQSSKQWAFDI